MGLTNALSLLREENLQIEQILEQYAETNKIYQDALTAMGWIHTPTLGTSSSAEVTLSLSPAQSPSTDKWSL